jgi:hypothetical protein
MGTVVSRRTLTGRTLIPTGGIQRITSSGISSSSTDAGLTAVAVDTQLALIQTTGSGAGWEVSLASGRPVGQTVTVVVANNSTAPVTLLLESTSQTLFGSTFNALLWSTDSSGTPATLVKVSTSQYALVSGDAAKVAPAASTGTA